MGLVKSVVIGLGAMIVFAIGLMVYGFYKKANDPAWKLGAGSAPAAPIAAKVPSALPPFGDVTLDVPGYCEIVATYGESGRLIFELVQTQDCPAAVVVDLATGRKLGSVRLK